MNCGGESEKVQWRARGLPVCQKEQKNKNGSEKGAGKTI